MKARVFLTRNRKIERMLKGMQRKDAERISKAVMRAQLNVVKKEMKKSAPVGPTKNLKNSIGVRLEKVKKKNTVIAKAGLNVGKRTKAVIKKRGKTHRAPHGHLVALGTKWRQRKTIGGKFKIDNPTDKQLSTGRMPRNNFIKQATSRAKPAMKAAALDKAKMEIQKLNKRRQ